MASLGDWGRVKRNKADKGWRAGERPTKGRVDRDWAEPVLGRKECSWPRMVSPSKLAHGLS